MLSRRSLLGASAALCARPAEAAAALRFGLIADPQYAEAAPNLALDRHYAASLGKLGAAVEILDRADLGFVATLGDVIDRDFASFERILPIYARLRHETRFLLGNHDFSVAEAHRDAVAARLGMPARYYDFAHGGLRFVVLDGNDVSLFGTGPDTPARHLAAERLDALRSRSAPNAEAWNGSLSDGQFAWLETRLALAAAAGERVIVLNHYPVLPENRHDLWDAERLVDLLVRSGRVVAYFNGHNHAGNYAERAGIHFVNLRGMVDTATESAFAIVEIAGARMAITGFGREPSRSLRLRLA